MNKETQVGITAFQMLVRGVAQVLFFVMKVIAFLLALLVPMWVVVLPYCALLAAKMPPVVSAGSTILAFGALALGAGLMVGIPVLAYKVYGGKLMRLLNI